MNRDLEDLRTLTVFLHGARIGVITRLAGDRQMLAFDQRYVDDPDRPVLSLSFKGRTGELLTEPRTYAARVPPFFSNLLPEGHLREYLAKRAGVKAEREFFLLAILGSDLPGAVTVWPGSQDDEGPLPASEEEEVLPESDIDRTFRFSLAGVQLKFSAIVESSGGLTIPAGGTGGSWIVKLPSTRFEAVPENEYVILQLARRGGIEVPEARLIDLDAIQGLPGDLGRLDGRALALRRFDRSGSGERIHMEDFAQVFGVFPESKYEGRSYANLAGVIWTECGPESTYEFVRRLAFCVLTGNADMHLKNWSLLYPRSEGPKLSPAYDLLSTVPYLPEDRLALSLGESRSLNTITRDQIRSFADKARLPVDPLWEIVCETSERTMEAWQQLDERTLLPGWIRKAVDRQIKTAGTAILED